MDRLETRELVYFVAVAEELHFRRAAERLGIAQPSLSRVIARLERRLGVRLLERTRHRVNLTTAGEVLLHESRSALAAVAGAARRAQRAGNPGARLVLVMETCGDAGLLPDVLAAYESEPNAIPVDVVLCNGEERAVRLREGHADVGLLRRSDHGLTGLDTEDLLVERQVVVVSERHRLAGRASVRLADLAGETTPRWPGDVPAGNGPMAHDYGEMMQFVMLGRMVAVLPESVLGRVRQNLVCVPVTDAPTTTLVVAWPEQSRCLATAAFVRTAVAVAAQRQQTLVKPPLSFDLHLAPYRD